MSNADPRGQRAEDDSAREADDDKSEEQMWDEIEAEEAASRTESDGPDQPRSTYRTSAESDDGEIEDLDADPEDAAEVPDKDDDAPDKSRDSSTDEGADGSDDDDLLGKDPKELEAQIERLQHQLASEKGRTAASRREITSLRDQIAAARKAQQDHSDEDLKTQREEREAEIEKAREEYGDVIGPLADQINDLQSRLERLSQQEKRDLEAAQTRYMDAIKAQEATFTAEHPDGFDVINRYGDILARWVNDQPAEIRQIYADNQHDIVDGTGAAYLLGLFKKEMAAAANPPDGDPAPEPSRLQSRRDQQLRGARTTRIPSRQTALAEPPPDSADEEAHWKYWEDYERRHGAG